MRDVKWRTRNKQMRANIRIGASSDIVKLMLRYKIELNKIGEKFEFCYPLVKVILFQSLI